MEQILRDSRIATIYEGTTGIQALDLVGRKVLLDKFKQLNMFTGDMLKFAGQFLPWKSQGKSRVLRGQAWAVAKLALKWRYLGYRLAMRAKKNADNVGAASVDFMMFSGYAYMAFMWLQMSAAAERQLKTGEGDKQFLDEKLHTAKFFFARILPRADAHARSMSSNVDSVMGMPTSYFE